MEAAASVAVAARGVSLTIPSSQPSRKEWRAVSDHPVQNSGTEDLDRSKLGQTDERLIYEVQQGRESVDVDFCTITIDGTSDHDILQQRLHAVMKQREELQIMETELKARLIAQAELTDMQERFDAQMKEEINNNVKLQEQLHDREKTIHDLRRTIEERDKELHAIRLDHEAAWAKEDLLREQNKELASFRRERDNSEAERAQHIKQIHDLQEHIQDKERQFMEVQEQHRVAQETILFKDEQLREAHAWIARVQEMDALQSTTNHSLQAELQERREQCSQLWIHSARQNAEMERLHLHIQQLQGELTESRERSGTYSDESRASQAIPKEASQFGQSNGSQLEATGGGTPGGNSVGLANGNAEIISSFTSTGNPSIQTDQVSAVQVVPQSLIGMSAYLQPGQVPALHPFVLHQQTVPQTVASHVSQSNVGHFHSVSGMSSIPQWQNQQAFSEGSQMSNHNQLSSENAQNSLRADTNYDYEVSVNGQAVSSDYLDAHISQGLDSHSVVPSPDEEVQVDESIDNSYVVSPQSQLSLQQISSQFHGALRMDPLDHNKEAEEKNIKAMSSHGQPKDQVSPTLSTTEAPVLPVKNIEATTGKATAAISPEGFVSAGQKTSVVVGKMAENVLLDEESLLACVVRTIPPGSGGRIRISSTLPNRLGKMLAPLHWHDYKKKYGKLDDFVASHPELFLIEDDYIQVREGAQEIISAMAARAKVRAAAAAAAASSHTSLVPSVAVTPMAQSNRLKKAPSVDSKSGKAEKSMFKDSQLLAMQNTHSNGFLYAGTGSNIKILSKHNDQMEPIAPSVLLSNGNGANSYKSDMGNSASKGFNQGRSGANFIGKQQGRSTGAVPSSRR